MSISIMSKVISLQYCYKASSRGIVSLSTLGKDNLSTTVKLYLFFFFQVVILFCYTNCINIKLLLALLLIIAIVLCLLTIHSVQNTVFVSVKAIMLLHSLGLPLLQGIICFLICCCQTLVLVMFVGMLISQVIQFSQLPGRRLLGKCLPILSLQVL